MSENIIATDSITLTSIQDSLTVTMSPSSCAINADFTGNNQNLDNAFTDLSLFLGPKQLTYTLNVLEVSDTRIIYSIIDTNDWSKRFRLTNVPTDILTGYVRFELITSYGDATNCTFQFTVVKDVNTLDWIKDWENNKTKIGADYLITPQIFVGKKVTSEDQLNVLTGVYIGPTGMAPNSSAGIYGYKEGKEIFHINETGGSIGGWDINNGGIQSADGRMQILSEGTLIAKDSNQNLLWGIYKSGDATFAKGNVKFNKDGSAYFSGAIESSSGNIGGWKITKNLLYSNHIILDPSGQYIGISPYNLSNQTITENFDHYDKVKNNGGIVIHYQSNIFYGMEGYSGARNTFKLGSTNSIAGWNFDYESLYLKTKNNNSKEYTSTKDSITIGTKGLRGLNWYIDTTGEVSFMGGRVKFEDSTGTLLGWNMSSDRLSNDYLVLNSEPSRTGLYLSSTKIGHVLSSLLESVIKNNSGIYIKSNSTKAELVGVTGGKICFLLNSSENSKIAGWEFNDKAIFYGTYAEDGFAAKKSITISTSGIRGYNWRIEPDGSGALAEGKINWKANGDFSFGETLSYSTSIKNGLILSNSIFVCDSGGTIKAGMSAQGSGGSGIRFFAGSSSSSSAPFRVDENGLLFASNAHIEGTIKSKSGEIGGFEIGNGRIGSSTKSSGGGGSLAIYNNFLRVGGNNGYVFWGEDVLPATVGGAFTATGRIVNNHVSDGTTNYGLLINVSGADKNYGISSDAPLKAPAFISTKVGEITFGSGGYSLDFTQSSIFFLTSTADVEVTLPTESSVASKFGYSSLPNNFGFIVTFIVKSDTKKIILKDIYNHDYSLSNYTLSKGDSVMLLVTNVPFFRYQIINHSK